MPGTAPAFGQANANVPPVAPVAEAQPQPGTPAGGTPTLTVVASDGVQTDAPASGLLEAGAIDPIETPKLEHDFLLRNDGKAPVTIARLQPTCGCTSVLLGENNAATQTLAPGEQVKVRVSVDVTRFHGAIHKAVRAFGDDDSLLATINITADIKDAVTFSTPLLDFGRVNFGTAASQPLTLTLSPRLVAMGNLPPLVSSNPDVQVTSVIEDTVPLPAAGERHYLIRIAPRAAIGQLSGVLSFALPGTVTSSPVSITNHAIPGNTGTDVSGNATAESLLRSVTLPITGEVVGKIAATPSLIVFGAPQAMTQRITLAGASDAILKNLKVSSSDAYITARFLAPGTGAATPEAVPTDPKLTATTIMELTLSPRAPAGSLNAKLIVTATDGERLNLTILGDVPPRQ